MVGIYIYIYGSQKLNIQQLISPVLMDQIASNFDKNGRIIVLPVCTVWCQSDHGNPLFLACENGKKQIHLDIIVAWLAPFGFGALRWNLLSVFFSVSPVALPGH